MVRCIYIHDVDKKIMRKGKAQFVKSTNLVMIIIYYYYN